MKHMMQKIAVMLVLVSGGIAERPASAVTGNRTQAIRVHDGSTPTGERYIVREEVLSNVWIEHYTGHIVSDGQAQALAFFIHRNSTYAAMVYDSAVDE